MVARTKPTALEIQLPRRARTRDSLFEPSATGSGHKKDSLEDAAWRASRRALQRGRPQDGAAQLEQRLRTAIRNLVRVLANPEARVWFRLWMLDAIGRWRAHLFGSHLASFASFGRLRKALQALEASEASEASERCALLPAGSTKARLRGVIIAAAAAAGSIVGARSRPSTTRCRPQKRANKRDPNCQLRRANPNPNPNSNQKQNPKQTRTEFAFAFAFELERQSR